MPIKYTLNKIKFATDPATFKRVVGLYEKGKVTEVDEFQGDYTAVVQGTKPYRVSVAGRNFKLGHCTCYLGQRETLCKHMVALAIYAVQQGRPLEKDDKKETNQLQCSEKKGALDKEALAAVKKSITDAMRYIKAYHGPSRTWFANQNSLEEGCHRLRAIVSDLTVSKQTADLLVKLLLRLDKKLLNGVDDSNGIVGGFMSELVGLLEEYTRIDSGCIDALRQLFGKETCFGWEESLIKIWDN